MRLAYGIHGYGRGHATRALAILSELGRKHDLRIFAGGDAFEALCDAYPVVRVPHLKFVYRCGRRSILRTLRGNLPLLADLVQAGSHTRSVVDAVRKFAPQVVLCDCEPFTARAAKMLSIPHVSLDHFGIMAHCKVGLPWLDWAKSFLDRTLYMAMFGRARHALVSSFYYARPRSSRVRVIGTLLRNQACAVASSSGTHLLAYFNRGAEQFTAGIAQVLRGAGHEVRLYGTGREGRDDSIWFRPASDRGFLGRLDVVRLSGGEPFLRDDLALVAEAVLASSRPAVLHVTTNGSFPERVERLAAEFSAPRRLHIMVSFDGLAPEHDCNRGRASSFANAFETVRRLARLRPRGGEVSANHTIISPQSLRDHAELRRRLDAIGVDVHWVLAYETSSMYGAVRRGTRSEDLLSRPGFPLHPALDARECQAFLESQLHEIWRLRARALRVGKRYYLRGLRERLRMDAAPRLRPKCVALRSHIRLLPNGRVPVCQFNTETVGDLSCQPFPTVWRGEPARRARAWVDACSGCWAECEVVPNALYSGDLWRAAV